jgi:hypothetical protein
MAGRRAAVVRAETGNKQHLSADYLETTVCGQPVLELVPLEDMNGAALCTECLDFFVVGEPMTLPPGDRNLMVIVTTQDARRYEAEEQAEDSEDDPRDS